MRRAWAATAAALGLSAAPGGAQVIGGRVVDGASRRPLPDVSVRLVRVTPADSAPLPADTTALARGRTDGDGVFMLAAPDPGRYRVRVGEGLVGPVLTLAGSDAVAQHEYAVPPATARALLASEVQKEAALVGPLLVRYPAELQARCAEGKVVAQFVVDTAGRAELGTFRVLQSPEPLFSRAVRDAVRGAAFSPAEVGGRRVRQLTQQPVTFALGGVGACVPLSPFGPPAGAARAPGVTWPQAAPR
jgi:TonB family protein